MTVDAQPVTYRSVIARTANRNARPSERVTATIEFEFESKATPAPHATTTHERCDVVRELSWSIVTATSREELGWDRPSTVEAWLAEWELALDDRWPMDDVERLFEIGGEWHMNGFNAGCAHQRVVWEDSPYGRCPSLTLTEPCPVTGYRYGSAWLVRRLGEGVEANVARLFKDRTGGAG